MSDNAPELHPFSDAPAKLEIRKESWRKETMDVVGEDGTAFGRIDYGAMSGKGHAHAAGAQWEFAPKGMASQKVRVTQHGSDEPMAEFDMGIWMRGGELDIAGATYAISASGMMNNKWTCERDGQPLFHLKMTGALGKDKGDIELTDAGRADDNIALLVLLVTHVNRASNVAASTAASAGGAAS